MAMRLSFFVGLKQNLIGHKFKVSLGGDRTEEMADNAGQGLMSTGYRKARYMIRYEGSPRST
jgi:hypothetical protein